MLFSESHAARICSMSTLVLTHNSFESTVAFLNRGQRNVGSLLPNHTWRTKEMTSRTATAVISAGLALALLFISAGKTSSQIGSMDRPDTKRAAPKPPSWRRMLQGQHMLSLPANYDKWFYLGKGPLTLTLIRPYSQIEIGGTNNSRNPFGGATLMDAQKSDPKALAPPCSVGSYYCETW